MQVFQEIGSLQRFLENERKNGKNIGFVPTMGALHEGHSALINASKSDNSITVCSIYINPTQFNNKSDLEKYPRVISEDKKFLENAGCDVLFCPLDQVMYPEKPTVEISFGPLDGIMEGKFRPGHFRGVGMVVAKLFHIVQPDNAYFGQKDLQQFIIIKRLVSDLFFNLNLIVVPIVREADGLAMSSRNSRLTPEQRKKAPVFYEALTVGETLIKQEEELSVVKKEVEQLFLRKEIQLEYFEVVESDSLYPVKDLNQTKNMALCVAGYLGEIRLIDNLLLIL